VGDRTLHQFCIDAGAPRHYDIQNDAEGRSHHLLRDIDLGAATYLEGVPQRAIIGVARVGRNGA
jgi:hypothetical protein